MVLKSWPERSEINICSHTMCIRGINFLVNCRHSWNWVVRNAIKQNSVRYAADKPGGPGAKKHCRVWNLISKFRILRKRSKNSGAPKAPCLSSSSGDFTFLNTQLNFCARCCWCCFSLSSVSVQFRTIFNWIKCSAASCIFMRTISRNRAYQARRRLRRHAPFGRTINLRPKNRTHVPSTGS